MKFNLAGHKDQYLHLHADCIPVKGASRAVICDLTRSELIFFPVEYYDVLEFLVSDKIGTLFNSIECDEEKFFVAEFINFLDKNDLIVYLNDVAAFPKIEERWDVPAIIHNAIIDVDSIHHNFNKIFNDLNVLGCQFVEVRCFSNLLKLKDIYQLLLSTHHKSIKSVDLLLKYDALIEDEAYIELVENQPTLSSLTIHSCPQQRKLIADYNCDEVSGRYIHKQISMVTQAINSQNHCGIISIKTLNAPSVDNFFETKLFNGCLNRKIAVDSLGELKNCPSMTTSFGNISDTSLSEAIESAGFKDKWKIKKDEIKVCKDCEFRYVCSDCRAYIEDPEDIYSKPLKCGYDPYTAKWEEWSTNPLKQKGIELYGLIDCV